MGLNLEQFSHISQIVVAVTAVLGAIILWFEYRRSVKNQRIDMAIYALKNWDETIREHTGPAIRLIEAHKNNKDILNAIRSNQAIKLEGASHRRSAYGFLINENDQIPAATISMIRINLMHYLNAWENLAYLYVSGRADPDIIEKQLNLEEREREDLFSTLESFMDIFPPKAWAPFRDMIRIVRAKRPVLHRSGQ